MPVPAAEQLLVFLQRHGFLAPAQAQQLTAEAPKLTDSQALARLLVEGNWLTPYQANQLLQGRGGELLLGPYRIIDRLGAGGMGQVFKAHHASMDRLVALKIIPKERVSNAVAVARFQREVRAVAKLAHPNIVIAFEVNQAGDTHFLAMEYVEGLDLARLVQQSGPLPVGRASEYIRQAAVGLQHAHEKGLVHRDIKPGNLMVSRPHPDEPPIIKILDFGLARFESERGDAERLTQLDNLLGTVDYIAPEQAQNARKADIRADIYSLGCSLYYLLAGQPPFPADDPAERISARLAGNAPSIRKIRADVPPELERVLDRMLARHAADRFATPSEVAKALEPFAERPMSSRPAPVPPLSETARSTTSHAITATPPERYRQTHEPIIELREARSSRNNPQNIWLFATGVGSVVLIALGVALAARFLRDEAPTPGTKTDDRVALPEPTPAHLRKKPKMGGTALPPQPVSTLVPTSDAVPTPEEDLFAGEGPAVGEVCRLKGHSDQIRRMALSPDGRRLLTAGWDRVIRVWDLRTRQVTGQFRGLGGHVINGVAFLPDGRRAIASGDKVLYLWNVDTGEVMRTFQGHKNTIHQLAVSPNGKLALTCCPNENLFLWDLETGKEKGQVAWHPEGADTVAFSPDGRFAAVGTVAGDIVIWEVATGRECWRLRGHVRNVMGLAFSCDGEHLFSCGSSDNTIRKWNIEGRAQAFSALGAMAAHVVALSPGGTRLLSAGREGRVWIWDARSKMGPRRALAHTTANLWDALWSRDGRYVFFAGTDNDVHVWRAPTLPPAEALLERGLMLTTASRWKQASDAFEKAFATDPGLSADGFMLWRQRIVLAAASGDFARLRLACRELESRTVVPGHNHSLPRFNMVAPGGFDPATCWRAAEKEFASNNHHWNRLVLGTAMYRAGQYEQAERQIREAMNPIHQPQGLVYHWLWLAMACQRQGEDEEARRWFNRGTEWMRFAATGNPPIEGDGPMCRRWDQRLELQLLLTEASTLIGFSKEKDSIESESKNPVLLSYLSVYEVNSALQSWQAHVKLPPGRFRVIPSPDSRWALAGGEKGSHDHDFHGSRGFDGRTIQIPLNPMRFGGLAGALFVGGKPSNVFQFPPGKNEEILSVPPEGGELCFIIGDYNKAYGDNHSTCHVRVLAID